MGVFQGSSGISDNWTTEQYKHYLATGLTPSDSAAIRATNMELDSSNDTACNGEIKEVHARVDIEVCIYRHATGDPDSPCAKFAIDALVAAQILKDDSRNYVRSVRYEEIPCEKGRDKTVIDIYSVGDER